MASFLTRFFRRKGADKDISQAEAVVGVPLHRLERRRWPRVPVELRVRIRFPTAAAAMRSRTFDISPGGAFIRMENPRPVGTNVRLMLEVGERSLDLAGVVDRVSACDGGDGLPGIGIRFTQVSAEDQRFLAELAASEP